MDTSDFKKICVQYNVSLFVTGEWYGKFIRSNFNEETT